MGLLAGTGVQDATGMEPLLLGVQVMLRKLLDEMAVWLLQLPDAGFHGKLVVLVLTQATVT